MDALDRRILAELQRDCSISANELARRCGTTESTALRRWKRLRTSKTIRAEVAVVDPPAVGRPLMMIVSIRLNRDGPANTAEMLQLIAKHPAVTQFYHVTGVTDYVAILSARTMADYEDFISAVLAADPHFATGTNVVIRALKMSFALPIEEPAGPAGGKGAAMRVGGAARH